MTKNLSRFVTLCHAWNALSRRGTLCHAEERVCHAFVTRDREMKHGNTMKTLNIREVSRGENGERDMCLIIPPNIIPPITPLIELIYLLTGGRFRERPFVGAAARRPRLRMV